MPTYKDTPQKRRRFLEAYERNSCLLYKTCKEVGLSPTTVINWTHKHPEFMKQKEELQELMNDKVVANLQKNAIDENNIVAQIFWLKNRRKAEWGDRQEVEHTLTKPLWFENKAQDAIEGEVVEQLEEGEDE